MILVLLKNKCISWYKYNFVIQNARWNSENYIFDIIMLSLYA